MTLAPHVTQQYNLGPVKPWVEQAAYIVGPMFGIKTIGGWRQSDPFPDHPSGHALDYMVPNQAVGDALAQYEIDNWQALGVKYIVWNHRAWNPKIGWHPYTSTNNPHTDHVHTTYNDTPGTTTSTLTGTPVGLLGNEDTCAWAFSGQIPIVGIPTMGGLNVCLMNKKQVRVSMGFITGAAGGVLIIAGVMVLVALAFRVRLPSWSQALPIISRFLPPREVHYHTFHHNVPEETDSEE